VTAKGDARKASLKIYFRLVQVFARWQVGKLFKMLRPERLGNHMLAAQPFAEVHQLAAVRAKRAEFPGKPVTGLFAHGANHSARFIWFRWQSL